MVPTLTHGDLVLVRRGGPIRPGDVVLAQFLSMPDRFVLKRAEHAVGAAWSVRSDNEFAGGDSFVHGPATVLGRVVLRWPAAGVSTRGPGRISRLSRRVGLARLVPSRVVRQPRSVA